MKLASTLLMLLVIGLLMAVPVSCVVDSVKRTRADREFRQKYGPDCERMNRAIQELNRIKARAKWEREQMDRIEKERPR